MKKKHSSTIIQKRSNRRLDAALAPADEGDGIDVLLALGAAEEGRAARGAGVMMLMQRGRREAAQKRQRGVGTGCLGLEAAAPPLGAEIRGRGHQALALGRTAHADEDVAAAAATGDVHGVPRRVQGGLRHMAEGGGLSVVFLVL